MTQAMRLPCRKFLIPVMKLAKWSDIAREPERRFALCWRQEEGIGITGPMAAGAASSSITAHGLGRAQTDPVLDATLYVRMSSGMTPPVPPLSADVPPGAICRAVTAHLMNGEVVEGRLTSISSEKGLQVARAIGVSVSLPMSSVRYLVFLDPPLTGEIPRRIFRATDRNSFSPTSTAGRSAARRTACRSAPMACVRNGATTPAGCGWCSSRTGCSRITAPGRGWANRWCRPGVAGHRHEGRKADPDRQSGSSRVVPMRAVSASRRR